MATEQPKLSATIATREILKQTYLDWWENYGSIDTFAEHYGLSREHGEALINVCRDVFNSQHPEA